MSSTLLSDQVAPSTVSERDWLHTLPMGSVYLYCYCNHIYSIILQRGAFPRRSLSAMNPLSPMALIHESFLWLLRYTLLVLWEVGRVSSEDGLGRSVFSLLGFDPFVVLSLVITIFHIRA